MSAETLRKAAGLMRDRAEVLVDMAARDEGSARYVKAQSSRHGGGAPFREHFEPWDAETALAVSEWLYEVAYRSEHFPKQYRAAKLALAVATAYLGSDT